MRHGSDCLSLESLDGKTICNNEARQTEGKHPDNIAWKQPSSHSLAIAFFLFYSESFLFSRLACFGRSRSFGLSTMKGASAAAS